MIRITRILNMSQERDCDTCGFVGGIEDPWLKEILTKSIVCLLKEPVKMKKSLCDNLSQKMNLKIECITASTRCAHEIESWRLQVWSWT